METVLLYALGVLVIVVGLALSIGLHEIGHLVPAKKFGVKVGQYMIGFGPTIWSKRFGETEYGVKALPLGGYISMAGMYPPAKPGERARNANTGFMDALVQDARTASADTVAPGDEDRVFYKLAAWKRIIIMLGGPSMNLLIAFVLYAIILCGIGIPQTTATLGAVSACLSSSECTDTDEPAPASVAGFEVGDRLVSIDGTAVATGDDASTLIRASAGEQLTVVVERDGVEKTLTVTPAAVERQAYDANGAAMTDANGDPVMQTVGVLGVTFTSENTPQPIATVPETVGQNIAGVATIIVTLPQRLWQVGEAAFGGQERDPNGPVGVIGIGRVAGEVTALESAPVENRIFLLLNILASLNVALFVFNLVPLLPLDGGHVAGAIWETIRRRFAKWFKRPDPGPVDIAKAAPVTLVIVGILGLSTILLAYADIVNPIKFL